MADLRLQGYRQAIAECGAEVDARLEVATEWFTRPDGYRATQGLISSGVRFDAIFCFSDLLAHGALRALAEADIRCPTDVAVAGVDDNEENQYSNPTLTSIAPSKSDIADRAVALLVSRIDGGEFNRAVDYVPTFSLRVRESAPLNHLHATRTTVAGQRSTRWEWRGSMAQLDGGFTYALPA